LVLAAALGLLAFASGRLGLSEVAEVSGVVAWINLGLALFNLIPAAPLDGGRILAAVVWRITGDPRKAGRVAARAGRAVGALLLTAGLFGTFFVRGGFIAGLWLVLVGWFLLQAALAEEARVELVGVLSGRRADALAFEEAEAVEVGTSLGWITQAQLRRHHLDAVPVDQDGRTVGIVHVDDISRIAPERRFETTAGDVMRPIEEVPRVAADDSASAVLAALDGSGLVAITEGDTVVALVTARQLAGAVQRLRLLQGAGSGAGVLR
ncbi:MAG TPA: site-2 protease family protein, partial [Acidimicrobiia bacterium]